MNRMTLDEKILVAANGIANGVEGFTAEELIVSAFQIYPENFSLLGFPQYPDSNRVLTQITTAKRGLQRRGWIRKLGPKRYELTNEAQRHLSHLQIEPRSAGPEREINRDITRMVEHWLSWLKTYPTAYARFKSSHSVTEINEREALAFWRLTSAASAAVTNAQMATAAAAVEALGGGFRRDAGKVINLEACRDLIDLHQLLIKHYAKALGFLRSQRQ
jgi:hypothetical protein